MNFYNDHENNIGAPNNNNNVIQTLDAPDQEIEVTSNEPKEHNAQYTEQTNQEVINNNNNTTKPPLTTHLPNNGSQLENNTNGITEKTTNDNDIDMEEQTLLDFLSIGDDDNDFWIGAQQISQSQLTTINSRIRNIENKIDISRSVTVLMNNIKTTYWCAFSEQARTEIRSLIPIGHTIITEPPRGEAIVLDRAAIIISVPLGHRNEVQQQVQTKLPTKPYFKWFLDDFNATREKCLIVFDADEQQLDKIIPTNGTSIIINGTKYSLEISHPKNLTLWMGPIPPKLAYNIKASKLKIFLEGQISKTKTQVVRVYIPKSDGLRKGEYVQVHCDSEMDVATIKRFHRKIGFTRGHIFDIFTPREYAESIARKIAEKRK